MAIQKNERRTVSHSKVENGYIITLNIEKETAKGSTYKSKSFVAKTATEADNLLKELIK